MPTKAELEHDLALMQNRLVEMAEYHDLCREYDEFVDDLNENLHVKIPLRDRDVDVVATITVPVTFSVIEPVHISGNPETENLKKSYAYDDASAVRDILERAISGLWRASVGDFEVVNVEEG